MDTNLTKIEAIALEWVSMDYESVSTILDNVAADFGSSVTKSELCSALSSLKEKGFVESYNHDREQNLFVPILPSNSNVENIWWLATASGINLMEKEASEE